MHGVHKIWSMFQSRPCFLVVDSYVPLPSHPFFGLLLQILKLYQCGMLLESRRVRELLNTTVLTLPVKHTPPASLSGWITPKTYSFSLNPFPALIILLLGFLMSAHHQDSVISTMIHKQWGTLLIGFSLARAFTYVITYISPPSSFLPSRPPTEVISAFCLISGGIIFMASNKDTVHGMEAYGLDAMPTFTLTMGLTGVLMAWTILLVGVRGWAVRKRVPVTKGSSGV